MIGWRAFVLLKNRPMCGECRQQAEGHLADLQKILGKSLPWRASNHFLRGMTNLMKVCGFCNPAHILRDGTGAVYRRTGRGEAVSSIDGKSLYMPVHKKSSHQLLNT
jgi:hypothetical protein